MIEIRETVVTPSKMGAVVELQISDAPLDSESSSFALTIVATLPEYEPPVLVEHFQREAMKLAQDTLTDLLQDLAARIQADGRNLLNPKPKMTVRA